MTQLILHMSRFVRCWYVLNRLNTPLILREVSEHRKVHKFWDAKNLCCNLPKIQTQRPNHRVFLLKDAIGIGNSEDPDQTAPLGAI